jgi:exonuclease SbcD
LKPFSFVHASDLHLGYAQYGLEARRQDFDKAFEELVTRTIELNPDFMIVAGDMFEQPRPANNTLETAITSLNRLRKAGIPVLTVDGSHDSAPNTITSTILNPLDSAGLVWHLPRHEAACWKLPGSCYVYGIPNYRMRRKTEESLPAFMEQNKPAPNPDQFNIFVFHMAIDLPSIKPPYMEAEVPPELIPNGFEYYAGGHIHETFVDKFKTGTLVYPGCTETTQYAEAQIRKGFYHVRVDEKKVAKPKFVELESPRKFKVIEEDFTGVIPSKINDQAVQLVKENDSEGQVLIIVLKGTLPAEANRSEIDVSGIRSAAEKALLVHPVVSLRESEVPDEIVRSIFESEFKDLKAKAYEYFIQIFSDRQSRDEAERIARTALSLIEPLIKKDEEKVTKALEELLR